MSLRTEQTDLQRRARPGPTGPRSQFVLPGREARVCATDEAVDRADRGHLPGRLVDPVLVERGDAGRRKSLEQRVRQHVEVLAVVAQRVVGGAGVRLLT